MATRPIKVMVIDAHEMVLFSLGVFLKTWEDLEPVGFVLPGEKAVQLCHQVQPDVVLIDIMGSCSLTEISSIHRLHQAFPYLRIIVLTAHYDLQLIQSAFQAGACGYHLKNLLLDDLAQAIYDAHIGKITLAPEIKSFLEKQGLSL